MTVLDLLGAPAKVYATGRHIKGHTGKVYLAPYGNRGSQVEIIHHPRNKKDPWMCGCDSLDAAFSSSADHTGEGWYWYRAVSDQTVGMAILYCALDLVVGGPVSSAEDRSRVTQTAESLVGAQIGEGRIEQISYDPELAPYRFERNGRYWARYLINLVASGVFTEVDFSPMTISTDAVLLIRAVLQ